MDPRRSSPTAANDTANAYHSDDNPDDSVVDGKIEMDQEEIDAIIRNKRKVRDPKACYACHRRKVKCDRNLPCDSCVKRDHPELCSYERPTKKRRIALTGPLQAEEATSTTQDPATQSGPNVSVPREHWDRINKELEELRAGAQLAQHSPARSHHPAEDNAVAEPHSRDETDRDGIHAPSNQMGLMHLGSRSVLAYMMGLGRSQSTKDTARTLLEENILPKLGLDNESATYPFVDLWSTESSMQDVAGLCKAIPDDDLCNEFFICYRDVACTIYPVVADTHKFSTTLFLMLSNRGRHVRDNMEIDPTKPYGVSLPWLSLMFAVFASGSQSSDRPAKERELTSQVYICCSYQALRMSNFLTHPCIETIEASLIIGNVLSYNMNPGVAYIFLGMTLRMAFSIGLQINSPIHDEGEQWIRRRVWWALAWQDSHFAVSYDRPTSSVMCIPDIPYGKFSSPGNRTYAESMFAIIRLTQEIVRERLLHPRSQMTWDTIRRYTEEVNEIVAQGASHLRERSHCHLMTEHLERLALKLHSSYITSELCRPALKESIETCHSSHTTSAQSPPSRHRKSSQTSAGSPTATDTNNIRARFRRECIKNLEGTVAAYVELHSLSKFAARSWIGIQRSISAAFLLGTLGETNREPRILALLRELEKVMTQRTMEDPTFDGMQLNNEALSSPDRHRLSATRAQMTDSPHWARSMAKSLNALGKLNAALTNPEPKGANYHTAPTNNQHHILGTRSNVSPEVNTAQGQSSTRSQYPSILNVKAEPYSPALPTTIASSNMGMGLGAVGMGPITPDSTGSSSDWNLGNLQERAAEYVQAPLWGDNTLGSYVM
ncbi:hypothetical protein B0A52_09681 [Exophiala mesophila]|uniref:Zn(2)-C6 fungal-type domain-containing protein n=1 Tax=Exophiala mesophila TaxID=212818 RepID=A0A438MS51_EXOME|nr:hypothetical protein B0A52_09681 [Exophiala mesophila]